MHHDVAILGSGFAGSLLSRLLRRRGLRVLVVEKTRHPRFALGESTTPVANLALERLARRYGLPDLHNLATWGRWQRHHPTLGVGLKRGFTFYAHRRGVPWRNGPTNPSRLLVAASPDDTLADTHWKRADLDAYLVERALAEDVEVRQATTIEAVEIGDAGVALRGHGPDGAFTARAGRVVDATGPARVIARALALERREMAITTGLVFAHVRDLPPFHLVAQAAGAQLDAGPYPDARAAVHHLLSDGWVYVLPFDDGTASVGFELRDATLRSDAIELANDPAAAWRTLLSPYPTLAGQLASATPVRPFALAPRLQHRVGPAAGPRYALLPHSTAFAGPFFSTGIAWSLLGVERLADLLTEDPSAPTGGMEAYAELIESEADQIERLLEAVHLTTGDFELFVPLAMLYFATVSFEEIRQRLLDPPANAPGHAWSGFLGAADNDLEALFAEALRRLRELRRPGRGTAQADRKEFATWIAERIAPRNVAGLADPARRHLYPVDLEVLVERAHLLEMSPAELRAALPRLRGDT